MTWHDMSGLYHHSGLMVTGQAEGLDQFLEFMERV